jgi:hypothetical protein
VLSRKGKASRVANEHRYCLVKTWLMLFCILLFAHRRINHLSRPWADASLHYLCSSCRNKRVWFIARNARGSSTAAVDGLSSSLQSIPNFLVRPPSRVLRLPSRLALYDVCNSDLLTLLSLVLAAFPFTQNN